MGGLGTVAAPSRIYSETPKCDWNVRGCQCPTGENSSQYSFIRSRRLGRFLRFTVEQTMAGRQAALKEYLVGVEVFGKTESFDPRIDSIVRVEARRLRAKARPILLNRGNRRPDRHSLPQGKLCAADPASRPVAPEPAAPAMRAFAIPSAYFRSPIGTRAGDHSFCSGLTEDVIGALTKTAGFRVVARAGRRWRWRQFGKARTASRRQRAPRWQPRPRHRATDRRREGRIRLVRDV